MVKKGQCYYCELKVVVWFGFCFSLNLWQCFACPSLDFLLHCWQLLWILIWLNIWETTITSRMVPLPQNFMPGPCCTALNMKMSLGCRPGPCHLCFCSCVSWLLAPSAPSILGVAIKKEEKSAVVFLQLCFTGCRQMRREEAAAPDFPWCHIWDAGASCPHPSTYAISSLKNASSNPHISLGFLCSLTRQPVPH